MRHESSPDAAGVVVTTYPTRGAGERTLAAVPSPALIAVPARRDDIEVLRVAAAVMVVAIHVTSQILGASGIERGVTWWTALVAGEGSRAAVPVFFAITGWLLLSRRDVADAGWLRVRLARLVVPLLAWSAIYIAVGFVTGRGGAQPLAWAGRQLVLTATGPGPRVHLWYLYFAIALTLAIWLIRSARESSLSDRRIVLAAGLALTVPIGLAPAIGTVTSWGSYGWAIGYVALGYAILSGRAHRLAGLVLFAVAAAALIVATAVVGYDTWPSFYPSPLVIAMTAGLLWAAVGVDAGRWRVPLRRAGALTLGVYLVHPLVMELVLRASAPGAPFAAALSPFPRLPLLGILILVLSFGVAAVWHRSSRLTAVLG